MKNVIKLVVAFLIGFSAMFSSGVVAPSVEAPQCKVRKNIRKKNKREPYFAKFM